MNLSEYKPGLCPNAESIQPKILAFRTNEWSTKAIKLQSYALMKTIKYFGT